MDEKDQKQHFIKKIIGIYQKIHRFDEKYEISFVSASTSFYMIVASFSLFILGFQFYNSFFQGIDNQILSSIYEMIQPIYYKTFDDIVPIFTLNEFSFVLLFSLLWSSSKVINGINKVADLIYQEIKKRNGFIIRLTSFLMFLMLFCILLFELMVSLFASNIFKEKLQYPYLYRILEILMSILFMYVLVLIIDMYAPPVPMKIKDAKIGAFIQSILLYIVSFVFTKVIQIYQKINVHFQMLSLISLLFIWIFALNYVIVLGLLFNYLINKKRANKMTDKEKRSRNTIFRRNSHE